MHHVGSCRETIRMINPDNIETLVLLENEKVVKIKDLLPEMYITKEE